jgi:hypothetical protein
MAYLGTPIDTRNTFQSLVGKRFNGDGSTTAFTLDVAPSSTLDIEVFVGNVRQDPNSAYTLSGTTLTFTGAPPSGTNNIYVVHQAKAVGTITPGANTVGVTELNLSDGSNGQVITTNGSGTLSFSTISSSGSYDLNGGELILDADADTSITADTDDQIDIKIAGTDVANITNSSSDLVITHAVQDKDIVFKGNDGGSAITALTIDMSTGGRLEVNGIKSSGGNTTIFNEDGGNSDFRVESAGNTHAISLDNGNERLNIASSSSGSGVAGAHFGIDTFLSQFVRNGSVPVEISRNTNDGSLVDFVQAGTTEGTVSVSGSTVSYNAFCGSHWSRLADNSKPTILRGTVMESIATMMTWYQAVADVEESTDSKGRVTPAYQVKEDIIIPDGKSIGDAVTFTSSDDKKEYTGVYAKEDNERLPMCKVSDTANSKAVYGVFMAWNDNDDGLDGDVNDMYVAALGAFVVRIHKDETVAIGDYLQSKGDGTAKKQADDILRASTIAKVTSTEKTHTYDDGSYCVPCTLHCG